jgi:hypothetical protein
MQVLLRRDSVAAGDDAEAPHDRTITVPNDATIETIITIIGQLRYLASISGGKATWSVTSRFPLAVVAQEWDYKPQMLVHTEIAMNRLDVVDGNLRLYFTYYAQLDPQLVFETLRRWTASGQGTWK